MVTTVKKARRSSTTAVPATPAAADPLSHTESGEATDRLVAQVLAQCLGPHLPQDDLLNCRLVCKEWCRSLPADRKDVLVEQLRLDTGGNLPALADIPNIFRTVQSLQLCMSERLSPSDLLSATTVLGDIPFYEDVRHLVLTSTSPQGSKSSTWPSGMPYWPVDLSGISALESLTVIGRAAQADLLYQIGATCKGLTSLVLGQNPEDTLLKPLIEQESSLATRPTGIEAIIQMTSLRRLTLQLDEDMWGWDEESGTHLDALAALTGLTELRIGGASVKADAMRCFLKEAEDLRHLSVIFDALSGRLHERRDLALWKTLQHVELRLQQRTLESDVPLLTLALQTSLKSLHLRSCSVSAYSLTALSSLVALRELSIGSWTPVGVLPDAMGEDGPSAAVCAALVDLLAGPVGQRLEVLRMDLSDPSKNIYGDMARLAEAWATGQLRVIHLVNADAYLLSSTAALAKLARLLDLQDLRVSVQGQACRDDSALRAAWLPPNLTSLELVGIHLPCAEQELRQDRPPPEPRHNARSPAVQPSEDAVQRSMEQPETSAAAGGRNCGASSHHCCQGHARLRKLQRLSLHACRFGCCGHLEAALGTAVMPKLTSLEMNDVGGLMEHHLPALAALTGLTSLSIGAVGHPCITSSSMAHVSGLTGLRRLRWHAGDSLDAPPHPAMLKPLRKLSVLDVSQGQWFRMSRWHFATALAEVLPLCEIAVT